MEPGANALTTTAVTSQATPDGPMPTQADRQAPLPMEIANDAARRWADDPLLVDSLSEVAVLAAIVTINNAHAARPTTATPPPNCLQPTLTPSDPLLPPASTSPNSAAASTTLTTDPTSSTTAALPPSQPLSQPSQEPPPQEPPPP